MASMGQLSSFFFCLLLLASSVLMEAAANDHHQQKFWKRKSSGSSSSSSSSSSSLQYNPRQAKSSFVLPLYGDVYPNGYYFAQVNIGQPPKPYFLDPDTGSDLTWLQCNAPCVHCTEAPNPYYRPSNELVPCKDPVCIALQPTDYKCDNPRQCDYEVGYADGGSSLGVLVNDVFSVNLTNGIKINPKLALGCGYDQLPGASHHPLDGVLGLGRGGSSIVSQLYKKGVIQNVIGHCLSTRGGYLFFGDGLYQSSRITWTPMSNDDPKHYSAGLGELLYGGRSTGIKNLNVIFDSGSSYTYLNFKTYEILLSMVEKEIRGKPLQEATDDRTLPFCWRGKRPFRNFEDIRKYFKPLALSFGSGWRSKAQFEMAPESYLIISSKGNACLGILNGTEIGLQNFNLIGDISMRDKLVVYDNQKKQIGWAPADCSKRPQANAFVL